MRILQLSQNYIPSIGGGVRYKSSFAFQARARGHQVFNLFNSKHKTCTSWHLDDIPSKIIYSGRSISLSLQAIPSFFRLLFCVDTIHLNYPSPQYDFLLFILYFLPFLPRPSLTIYYHADIHPSLTGSRIWNHLIFPQLAKQASYVLVSNPNIFSSSPVLTKYLPDSKLYQLPFGVPPLPQFPTISSASQPHNCFEARFLFVGRLSRYKGLPTLIEASNNVLPQLTIVGQGPLYDYIVTNNTNPRLQLLGSLSDEELQHEYNKADVLILPSTDSGEAFGYVLIEAMRAHCALITTELGTGTSWINQNDITGYNIKPGDSLALGEAISRLQYDREVLSGFQKRAYERYSRNFTEELFHGRISAFLDVIHETLE